MSSINYKRLIKLAEDIFNVKNDPDQLDVNSEVLHKLELLHPATVSELSTDDGPVAWVLVIPTTLDLMEQFLNKTISEKQLFNLTPVGAKYDALYLCSALVLEEYRRQGITKQLALEAIDKIRSVHPVEALFVWPFSDEGDLASEHLANLVGLPLYKRID